MISNSLILLKSLLGYNWIFFKKNTMKIYTIGFTKKSAQVFFDLLKSRNIQCLIDIRLRPDSQLAGFAKKEDLRYFLKQLNKCEYIHDISLAPTDELLKKYRINKNWQEYEQGFNILLDERRIPATLDQSLYEKQNCCFLCSEATADFCHRRLVAERLQKTWKIVEIIHL